VYVNDHIALQQFPVVLTAMPKVCGNRQTYSDYYYNHSPKEDQKATKVPTRYIIENHDLPLIFSYSRCLMISGKSLMNTKIPW